MTAATSNLSRSPSPASLPADTQDDTALLRSFVTTGSQASFAALVGKYLGFVLGIAVRKTSDRSLAEDIAQNVFTILARKAARLKPDPTLAGWLHRVTVIECAEAMRRELSHKTRMNAASEQFLSESGGHDIWRDALPWLDEGIGELAHAERQIILLRFFDRKSFREIGAALGKSDDAAQKQTERALHKLSAFLKKKGVAVSVATLASGLAAQVAHAAPAALTQSIALGALDALAAASSLSAKTLILKSIHAMSFANTKTKAAIVASLIAIPAIVIWSGADSTPSTSSAQKRLSHMPSPVAAHIGAPDASSTQGTPSLSALSPSSPTLPGLSAADASAIAATWKQALLAVDPLERTQQLSRLLASLTPESAPAVATAFEEAKGLGLDFADEQRLFLRAWGKIGGQAAVEYALGRIGPQSSRTAAALAGWASTNPQSAAAWASALPEDDHKESLICGLLDGWSTVDFRAAAAFAESRPANGARDQFRQLLLQRALRAGGVSSAQQWAAGIANDEANRDYKRQAFGDVVQTMLYRDPAAASHWISQWDVQPFVPGAAIADTAAKLAETSSTAALDWLNSLKPADSVAHGAGRVLQDWAQRDITAAGTWLAQNSEHPFYNEMALSYVRTVASTDRAAATAWAQSISDETIRTQALEAATNTSRFQDRFVTVSGGTLNFNGLGSTIAYAKGANLNSELNFVLSSDIATSHPTSTATIITKAASTQTEVLSAAYSDAQRTEWLIENTPTTISTRPSPHASTPQFQNCTSCHK